MQPAPGMDPKVGGSSGQHGRICCNQCHCRSCSSGAVSQESLKHLRCVIGSEGGRTAMIGSSAWRNDEALDARIVADIKYHYVLHLKLLVCNGRI